ncbi:hypothetical protein DPX16_19097 [Anabarilius grahami]|uniref:Integrase core domain-containing protein n=1 Tax=Anabarilius grahami TaxID=495550 RepID=A0A3N0YVU1_ANAGA|nr:hypothetical protein DPX16_19097 [Anabarilius grahami]
MQVIEQIPENSSDSETSDKDDEVFVNLQGELDTENESDSSPEEVEDVTAKQCPGTVSDELTEAGLIQKYFSEGHTYDVILDFLGTKHNIFLSLSTLKRRLRNAGLTRRTDYTPSGTVDAAITHELTGSDFGLPARLRTDCGTENGTMVAIHCALRAQHTDDFAGAHSHMYGTSTANQRIESWWSFFRKQRTQFWIELFSDLRERHLFNGSHEHKCLLRYVFLSILQKDLDEYRELWNNHTIRPVRQSCCHSGKPEAMYYLPHRFNARDCGFPVSQEVIQEFEETLPLQRSLCGDGNLQVHFEDLQRQNGLHPPVNWITAVENYITLKNMSGL